MTVDRITRLNELNKQEIGEAIFRFVGEPDFDRSAVTVTRVITSRSLQHARVMISIRDHEAERESMLNTLRQHRHEIQQVINRDLHLKYTPKLIFELDLSIEKGDHVLGVLAAMEQEEGNETESSDGPSGAPTT